MLQARLISCCTYKTGGHRPPLQCSNNRRNKSYKARIADAFSFGDVSGTLFIIGGNVVVVQLQIRFHAVRQSVLEIQFAPIAEESVAYINHGHAFQPASQRTIFVNQAFTGSPQTGTRRVGRAFDNVIDAGIVFAEEFGLNGSIKTFRFELYDTLDVRRQFSKPSSDGIGIGE
jgi:hypothetical protein